MRKSFLLCVALLALSAPAYAVRVSAWIPAWDANAVTIMGTHARDVDESNPGWFTAMSDGTIAASSGGESANLRAALTGTLLVPTIKNYVNGSFDGAMIATIANDPARRESHAEAIRQLVVTRAYDGIDVDYERVPSASRSSFSAFVQLLASKLHASGKVLSVTVPARTSDGGAYDWTAIGAAADSVKIMAYDYHWSTSAAGAITPLDWLDQVATYAESTLPSKKAMIGLPWYGYDWLGTAGSAVTYAQAMSRAQSAGAAIERDLNGEPTFVYGGRTVFFQDAESYRRKTQAILTRHPGIGGFAHWRVGAEDPAVWDVVSQMRSTGSAPAAPPQKDFAIDGPAELSLTAGTQATASYRFVPINGFAGPVTMTARSIDPFAGSMTVTGTSLTVAVSRTTAAGSYRVAVTMTGGGISHESVLVLRVAAPKSAKRRAVR